MIARVLTGLVLALSVTLGPSAQAAMVLFDFNNPAARAVGTNFSGGAISSLGNWTLRDPNSSLTFTNATLTSPSSFAAQGDRWNDNTGNAFTFTFTVPVNYSITFTDGSFLGQVSSATNSPTGVLWNLMIGTQAFGTGTIANNTSGGSSQVFNPADLTFGTGSYTVSLAAIDTRVGSANNNGAWRIDNFSLNGTALYSPPAPVPLPAAAWLLLSGLGGLGLLRRRKRI